MDLEETINDAPRAKRVRIEEKKATDHVAETIR